MIAPAHDTVGVYGEREGDEEREVEEEVRERGEERQMDRGGEEEVILKAVTAAYN